VIFYREFFVVFKGITAHIEELVCRKSMSCGKLGNLKSVVHLQLNLLIS